MGNCYLGTSECGNISGTRVHIMCAIKLTLALQVLLCSMLCACSRDIPPWPSFGDVDYLTFFAGVKDLCKLLSRDFYLC